VSSAQAASGFFVLLPIEIVSHQRTKKCFIPIKFCSSLFSLENDIFFGQIRVVLMTWQRLQKNGRRRPFRGQRVNIQEIPMDHKVLVLKKKESKEVGS